MSGKIHSALNRLYLLTEIDNAAAVREMPISLQLTGRRLEEEKVLAVTERVLEAF